MVLIKIGRSEFASSNVQSLETLADDFDLDIHNRMKKIAEELKIIAPKADDFLYFTCVMMHAAEASLIDDSGEIKKHADGTPIIARWEPVGDDSIRWVCSDPSITPYRNSNRDIFPEIELKKAYKKWVDKPLCVDHQSQNAEAVRGIILDTVYDDRRKRVIALCALDKKNHPKLAHNIATAMSTNVSMGTAVGRAVCTELGCHRVARTEPDFCNHMRGKNGYGEVNLDLNPLELSIVFSGADPKAKIKHVVAKDLSNAADSLNNYVNNKISTGSVSKDELVKIQEELEKISDKVKNLVSSEDENDTNYGMTGSSPSMQQEELSTMDIIPNPPQTELGIVSNAVLGIQQKVAQLQEGYEKLSNMLKNNEENMVKKKAYHQGTEEPNVGGTTYKPDPMNEQLRDQDKHMVGKSPFPNTGGNDGMYPGDAEKKKELQRMADMEERRTKRAEALKKAKEQVKSGYHQGTEEANVGGTTYKPDPMNEKLRNEDKHMVGKSPFPGVGDINGLYGDDKKVKEMLSRASWSAKLRKVSTLDGTVDKGASRWDVYASVDGNSKLMLSASVDQISGGRADVLYDGIATKEFGHGILSKIKSEGFFAARDGLLKNAQPAPAMVPPAPGAAMPAPAAGGVSAPAGDLEAPENDGSEDGKVKALVEELGQLNREVTEIYSDLQEALEGVKEDSAKLDGVEPLPEDKFAAVEENLSLRTLANYRGMQKTLNNQLVEGIGEALKDLKAHSKEIELTKDLYESRYAQMSDQQKGHLNHMVAEAVVDAKSVIADALSLFGAVVKYAQGTEQLEKRAQDYTEPVPQPTPAPIPEHDSEDLLSANDKKDKKDDEKSEKKDKKEDKDEEDDKKDKEDKDKDDKKDKKDDENDASDPLAWFNPESYSSSYADDEDKKDDDRDPMKGLDGKPLLADDNDASVVMEVDPSKIKLESGEIIDLTTKEGRAMYRTKLAQQGVNWSNMPGVAHPGGSVQPKLDVKPSDKDAKFHSLQETHDKVMSAVSVKTKKQAEEIHNLVAAGELDAADVDELAKHGIDKDAIAYYKKYWAEAKDPKANEFATKLTQEHANQKKAEDESVYKLKVKQAYELANQMFRKDMIAESEIDKQVAEILQWNDKGFESMKKIVAKQEGSLTKSASIPNVGMLESGDVMLASAQAARSNSMSDTVKEYENLFSQKKVGW